MKTSLQNVKNQDAPYIKQFDYHTDDLFVCRELILIEYVWN